MLGVSRTVLASEMPAVEPLPPYKAWDYLVSNELAQGVGRQMYYTDEIGICQGTHPPATVSFACFHRIIFLSGTVYSQKHAYAALPVPPQSSI